MPAKTKENLPEVQVSNAIIQMDRNREKVGNALKGLLPVLANGASDEVKAWPQEKREAFMDHFAYEVCNDHKLIGCFNTDLGKKSIIDAAQESLETGLKIGGKHAFLVPQKVDGKLTARFSIKADGYIALLCGGKKSVFKDIRWGKVYENDDFRVDESNAEIKHFHKMVDRGKFLGVWVLIIKKNGEKQVFTYTKSKIEQWKQSAQTKSVWDAWPEEMAEQACIRHACSRFKEARDALSESWGSVISKSAKEEQPDDIAARVEAIMPDTIEMPDTMEEEENGASDDTEEQEETAPEEEAQQEDDIQDGDLF